MYVLVTFLIAVGMLASLFIVPMILGHRENMAKIKMGIDPDE